MDGDIGHIEVNSLHSVKILLCYLLNKLNVPITHDELVEIIMDSEIINYFYFSDAIAVLEETGAVIVSEKDGKTVYTLGEKGRMSAEFFSENVHEIFRKRLMTAALRHMSVKRRNAIVDNTITDAPNGCYLNTVIKDSGFDLLKMSIYAPDREQAEFMKDKIFADPVEFYRKVIDFVLDNKEEEP